MRRLITTISAVAVALLVSAPSADAQDRGRGRNNGSATRPRTEASRPSSPSSSNRGSYRPGNAGRPSSTGTSRSTGTVSNSRPGSIGGSGYRPGNSGSGNGQGYRPGGSNDRPGNGGSGYRPGGNDRPGDRPGGGNGFRPGGNDRPGHGNDHGYRPGGGHDRPGDRPGGGNGFRPGGNDRPGHGNDHGYRPGGGHDRPGDRPGGGIGHRPGGGHDFRPDHGPGHGPGHRPDHGFRPPHDHYRPGHWRPMPRPPYRPFMPAYRPWCPPVRPVGFRPYIGCPNIVSVLGVIFGTTINVTLDALYNNGYNIAGYMNNAIYLTNVSLMNVMWPNVTLSYSNGGLRGSEFTYSSPGYDMSRYNIIYNQLYRQYGQPVSTDASGASITTTWWGYDNGYIRLSFFPDYAYNGSSRYYTTLSIGN